MRSFGTIAGLAVILALGLGIVGPAAAEEPAEKIYQLKIEFGKVAGNVRLVRVKQGDTVRIKWTADAPAHLHLHGYDVETEVIPGTVAETVFEARATGRFPINLHGGPGGGSSDESALIHVEVHPR